ncbi:hypothetical protein KIPB_005700 [Kipferlia bialata]|uniref:Uncharacterized protein n=1 Tax=Kipferlia bialata TaxID=797122 RepID=A0A9K3CXK3_9EUKA|nr:hypothetical protein KIPB_005700 [Kipferlia bialata]|eukprot:g5700.t1
MSVGLESGFMPAESGSREGITVSKAERVAFEAEVSRLINLPQPLYKEMPKLVESFNQDAALVELFQFTLHEVMSVEGPLAQKLAAWEKYSPLWAENIESYLVRFEEDIESFKSQQISIAEEDTVTIVRFLQLETSSIKQSLVNKALQWQNSLLELLFTESKAR